MAKVNRNNITVANSTTQLQQGALEKHVRLFTPSYCCILAANFLLFFSFWLLIPLLPFYLKEIYGQSESIIGAILCVYTGAALFVRPFSGYILDSFPRKPLYLMAYGIFCCLFLGYIAGGLLFFFILLRFLHGLAFGMVTVGGNTVVVDIMPSQRRGEGLGYYGLTNNTAMSIGPMVGLFLHGSVSYEWIFCIALITSLVGLTLATFVKTPQKQKIKRPAISLDRFILLKGIPAGIALLLLSIPYGATTNYVAMYVSEINMDVPAGLYFTLMAIGMGVSRIFAGKYVDKGYVTQCIHFGFYPVITAFLLLAACAPLNEWNHMFADFLFFIIPLLQGIGFGIMFPAYNSLYINLAQHNQRATATSTYLTSWDVGLGLGIFLGGLIAEHFSFAMVYFIGGLLCVISMIYFNKRVIPHYNRNKQV